MKNFASLPASGLRFCWLACGFGWLGTEGVTAVESSFVISGTRLWNNIVLYQSPPFVGFQEICPRKTPI
jgi:hypothetical protein